MPIINSQVKTPKNGNHMKNIAETTEISLNELKRIRENTQAGLYILGEQLKDVNTKIATLEEVKKIIIENNAPEQKKPC